MPVWNGTTYLASFSDLQANGSGALGSFTYNVAGPSAFKAAMNFLAIRDAADDEFDINLSVLVVPAPVDPSFGFGSLYSCFTSTCVTDFAPPSFQGRTPPEFALLVGGPAEFTVRAIPEPSTLPLLVCGLFLLGRSAHQTPYSKKAKQLVRVSG